MSNLRPHALIEYCTVITNNWEYNHAGPGSGNSQSSNPNIVLGLGGTEPQELHDQAVAMEQAPLLNQ
eukprot:13915908-Heterocapsa_arctica.AAC.1